MKMIVGRMRMVGLVGLDGLARLAEGRSRLAQAYCEELVLHLSRPAELSALTARAYDRNPRFCRDSPMTLFAWEQRIIAELLPAPPARILVGAAGGGRELVALAARGYQVVGFEPGKRMVAAARARLPGSELLAVEACGYEELVADPPRLGRYGPFDAIVLGWGSLSHLRDGGLRLQLLDTCRRLSPGPLLVSWVADAPGELELGVRKRLRRLGLDERDPRESYSVRGGYSRGYQVDEIFLLARETGYRVVRYAEGRHPHAVLAPR